MGFYMTDLHFFISSRDIPTVYGFKRVRSDHLPIFSFPSDIKQLGNWQQPDR